MFNASALTASLTVADIQKSNDWYRDVLGFEVQQEYEREGAVRAIALQAGDVRILLNQEDGAKGRDRVKGQGMSLQFITNGSVDEVAARVKASGHAIDAEPADMPWGMRMFRLTDPDGFRLVFSSPLK